MTVQPPRYVVRITDQPAGVVAGEERLCVAEQPGPRRAGVEGEGPGAGGEVRRHELLRPPGERRVPAEKRTIKYLVLLRSACVAAAKPGITQNTILPSPQLGGSISSEFAFISFIHR